MTVTPLRDTTLIIMVVSKMIAFLAVLSVLVSTSIANAANGETLVTQKDRVEVRAGPSSEAPVIMVLQRGRKLKELRRSGPWVKAIIYGTLGKDGWVLISEVAPLPSEIRTNVPKPKASKKRTRPPSSPNFVLVITGTRQPFKVRCIVVDSRGAKRRIRIKGHKPRSIGLNERAVDCRVDRIGQHAGTLRVELYARGSSLPLGANSTYDDFGCVHVRSDGPWGKAYGRRCSRIVRF